MKSRYGWVSNSSSSSFVIAWKNKKLLDLIDGVIAIPETHPFSRLMWEIAKELSGAGEVIKDLKGLEKYRKDGHYEKGEVEDLKELIEKGYTLRVGSWSNENGDDSYVERFLADNDLNVDTEDLKIIHEGGY